MAESHLVGCLLGTAVGDELGLPYEGLSLQRAKRLLGSPDRHRLWFSHGMISDDTEHTCFVAQSLIESEFELDKFDKRFASKLKWWIAAIPAGVGLATMRSCVKLWLGFSTKNSGVFSAGNGPAMRSAIFGAVLDDPTLINQFVAKCTRITHTDPKAQYGALAVALASNFARHYGANVDRQDYLRQFKTNAGDLANELTTLLEKAINSVERKQSTIDFAKSIGLEKGISGYVYKTVPFAIHAWLSYPDDYQSAVSTVISCGGDTDTTGAIVGGIVGTAVGEVGIPASWIAGIRDWPITTNYIRNLASQLNHSVENPLENRISNPKYISQLIRNGFFLSVVLYHGFRRLLPPY